jgi:homoserine dehydrogenase
LLREKERELRERDISWRVSGVATRRLGWLTHSAGFDTAQLETDPTAALAPARARTPGLHGVREWLQAAGADVLFEATSLNPQTGQPAIDHIRAALKSGAHAITANKGPIVHAYDELRSLAAARGRRFLFESTVMDGVPIFSMFRDSLPAVHLRGFRGVLNSTTNVILTGMEEGLSFEESLAKAQQIGVAETDATQDIDGWDAAVKVAALVTVLMGVRIRLDAIEREGIGNLSGEAVRAARTKGKPYKLVCRAQRTERGVTATVRPEQVPLSDPLAWVAGTSSIVYFETDIFPGLAITENHPGLEATAYGMLADFVRAVTQ